MDSMPGEREDPIMGPVTDNYYQVKNYVSQIKAGTFQLYANGF